MLQAPFVFQFIKVCHCVFIHLLININCPLFILRSRNFFIQRLKGFLVAGIKRRNPRASVINPGVSRTIPPTSTQSPSRIASPGIWPVCICLLTFWITSDPSLRASQAPRIPVPMINKTVGIRPKVFPERSNRAISKAGTIIIKSSSIRNIT